MSTPKDLASLSLEELEEELAAIEEKLRKQAEESWDADEEEDEELEHAKLVEESQKLAELIKQKEEENSKKQPRPVKLDLGSASESEKEGGVLGELLAATKKRRDKYDSSATTTAKVTTAIPSATPVGTAPSSAVPVNELMAQHFKKTQRREGIADDEDEANEELRTPPAPPSLASTPPVAATLPPTPATMSPAIAKDEENAKVIFDREIYREVLFQKGSDAGDAGLVATLSRFLSNELVLKFLEAATKKERASFEELKKSNPLFNNPDLEQSFFMINDLYFSELSPRSNNVKNALDKGGVYTREVQDSIRSVIDGWVTGYKGQIAADERERARKAASAPIITAAPSIGTPKTTGARFKEEQERRQNEQRLAKEREREKKLRNIHRMDQSRRGSTSASSEKVEASTLTPAVSPVSSISTQGKGTAPPSQTIPPVTPTAASAGPIEGNKHISMGPTVPPATSLPPSSPSVTETSQPSSTQEQQVALLSNTLSNFSKNWDSMESRISALLLQRFAKKAEREKTKIYATCVSKEDFNNGIDETIKEIKKKTKPPGFFTKHTKEREEYIKLYKDAEFKHDQERGTLTIDALRDPNNPDLGKQQIVQKYVSGKRTGQLETTIDQDSSDHTILRAMDLNRRFVPLSIEQGCEPALAIRIYEAARVRGLKVNKESFDRAIRDNEYYNDLKGMSDDEVRDWTAKKGVLGPEPDVGSTITIGRRI